MEVHHHSNPHGKKWTHYLWEFLMLFLAVFCGFMAEYQLEHKLEKSRERQYIRSFVEDLAADTIDLEQRRDVCQQSVNIADSLISILSQPDRNKRAVDIYYFFRLIHRSNVFNVNDRTMVQLRNAGGMRLVSHKSVSDSMISYYKEVDFIRFVYEEQIEFRRSLRPFFPKILDGIDYGKFVDDENKVIRPQEPVRLRSEDPETINACILILQNIKGINSGIRLRLYRLKEKARAIRSFILKEYHL